MIIQTKTKLEPFGPSILDEKFADIALWHQKLIALSFSYYYKDLDEKEIKELVKLFYNQDKKVIDILDKT